MPNRSSKELLAFYEAWYFWATSVAPEESCDHGFSASHGLCTALYTWAEENTDSLSGELSREMRKQFLDAGLSVSYPFGELNYAHDAANGTMHYDRCRLTWVAGCIEEARNAN